MMAFIEQEAKEKVDEIDAKVNKGENHKLSSIRYFGGNVIEQN